jgi:hypothetical protein
MRRGLKPLPLGLRLVLGRATVPDEEGTDSLEYAAEHPSVSKLSREGILRLLRPAQAAEGQLRQAADPLALLAPQLVEAVCAGQRPPDLTVEELRRPGALPLEWQKQISAFGLPG